MDSYRATVTHTINGNNTQTTIQYHGNLVPPAVPEILKSMNQEHCPFVFFSWRLSHNIVYYRECGICLVRM